MNTINISNSTRDFVAEAQATGSSAKTIKGALKYLVVNHCPEGERFGTEKRWKELRHRDYRLSLKTRKADPEAKRARDDRAYRKIFLARLRREEKRLIADPNAAGPAVTPEVRAYERLEEIARLRAIATRKPEKPIPPRDWRKPSEIRDMVRELALNAGLRDNWDGSSYCDDRGDYFSLNTLDSAQAPAYMAAPGTVIGLVSETRRRIYAKRSDFRMSERCDHFLVGQNENGNPFLHQVPNKIDNLEEAFNWIWHGAEVIKRQGDIAVAPSNLKHVDGEEMDIPIGDGHSRHRFIGEVYRNGSLHVRSGFLIHTAEQHPAIYLDGSCWRRIVVARRSSVGMSTAD